MKKPKLGKGKNMSIAKAALIFFFEDKDILKYGCSFLTWGDLNAMHAIVDIAGANHCSFFTAVQVIACLRNSPYWKCEFVPGMYSGFQRGHGGASCCSPSEKGRLYYERNLKQEEDK